MGGRWWRRISWIPWRRTLLPETTASYNYQLFPVKNAQAFSEGKVDFSQVGVKALDDATLEVELENPTPYFLSAGRDAAAGSRCGWT